VLLPPQTRVEETVLDLVCAAGTLDNAVAWVTRALGRRLTTQARLRHAMELRAKMSWRTEIAALLSPDAEGMHSILEYRYHRDVERPHGLPEGTRQARFRQGSRKCLSRPVLPGVPDGGGTRRPRGPSGRRALE
jgi:hypothetical protein